MTIAAAAHPPADASAKPLLDVDAVAALLDCSPRHIRRMTALGLMPAPCRLGFLVRWSRRHLESWIEAGCPPCRTEGSDAAN
jgi:predicted DNA-binding transcriptional regulator AlpA